MTTITWTKCSDALPDDETVVGVGWLMAAGIEVRTVADELSIGNLCSQAVLR